jgi:hypothetical protein
MVSITGLDLSIRTTNPSTIPITYVMENGSVKLQPIYNSLSTLAQGIEYAMTVSNQKMK